MEKEKIVVIDTDKPQFETEEQRITTYWGKTAPPELLKQWQESWGILNDEAKKIEMIKSFQEQNPDEPQEQEVGVGMEDVLAGFDKLAGVAEETQEEEKKEYEPNMDIVMEWIFTIKRQPVAQPPKLKMVWPLW